MGFVRHVHCPNKVYLNNKLHVKTGSTPTHALGTTDDTPANEQSMTLTRKDGRQSAVTLMATKAALPLEQSAAILRDWMKFFMFLSQSSSPV